MDVLFVGHFFSPHLYLHVVKNSNGTLNLSNHKFETVLIKGLIQQKKVRATLLTLPAVGYYPTFYNKIYIRKEKFKIRGVNGISVGFLNIPVLKIISKVFVSLIHATKWLCKIKKKRNTAKIIVSTSDIDGLLVAVILKKIFSNIHISVVIGDLPEFLSLNVHYKLGILPFFKMINCFCMSLLSRFDSFVIVTEAMKDKLPINGKPYVVMEGAIDLDTIEYAKSEMENVILYTGSLRKIFGINDLLDAFRGIDDSKLELWICGAGEAVDDIKKEATLDKRIHYLGVVNVETAVELQRKVKVLVNPRTADGEYTKYSFPSKTLEYMLSGTPIIMRRLPGIPEEYYQYVFIPQNNSSDALRETIIEVCKMKQSELLYRGKLAQDYVLKNKNCKIQVENILKIIK